MPRSTVIIRLGQALRRVGLGSAETLRRVGLGSAETRRRVGLGFAETLGKVAAAATLVIAFHAAPARAESPGLDALDAHKVEQGQKKAVENRFFLKESRFEVAPIVGYVPNNPFARRYIIGGILGYHFSEVLSAQAQLMYSPDLGENDLKGLVSVLLDRAYNADADNATHFQQPLDKVGLAAAFGVSWAPIYGKINLVGETVLNFDFYLFGGAGMVSKADYVAKYDTVGAAQDPPDVVNLEFQRNSVKVAPYIGIGQNYFLNRLMALKIDVRAAFYVADAPQYDPAVDVTEQRLYNNVVAGVGFAFFFPNMKPRLYNF
jgi:outer membrane beta-barrel protein